MTPTRVAVIGLGRMGGPIADHLIAAGHDVAVFDISADAMASRVEAGATAASTPADAAAGAGVVNVIVFDDAQAIEVVAGVDGVLKSLSPGSVVCIHTTVSLDTIHELARRADDHEVTVLDAGISGGEDGATAGTLLTMVGGPEAAVERVRTVLGAFSKEVVHPGPLGAGMALKLARNATGYAMMVAVHEAMVVAKRSGVDLDLLRHTISETGVLTQSLSSFALGGPDPLPADAPDTTRHFLEHLDRLAAKDLDQCLALAERVGADTPLFASTREQFRHVARLG